MKLAITIALKTIRPMDFEVSENRHLLPSPTKGLSVWTKFRLMEKDLKETGRSRVKNYQRFLVLDRLNLHHDITIITGGLQVTRCSGQQLSRTQNNSATRSTVCPGGSPPPELSGRPRRRRRRRREMAASEEFLDSQMPWIFQSVAHIRQTPVLSI